MQSKLFKKSSMDRITSPEKLNDYIQVANPSSWIVLIAALSLVIGLLVWGIAGKMDETLSVNGVMKDGMLQCYVPGDSSELIKAGMPATIRPMSSASDGQMIHGSVFAVADHPISYDEASKDIHSDFVLVSLGITGWNTLVTIQTEAELYEGVVYTVSIVTDTLRPIDMIFQ